MVAILDPLQSDATSGAGKTLTVPDPGRIVQFFIQVKGAPMGEITIECCPMAPVPQGGGSAGLSWRTLTTVTVPTDSGTSAVYTAGKVSGIFRARISAPISGGTVTVFPFADVLIGNANAALEPVVR